MTIQMNLDLHHMYHNIVFTKVITKFWEHAIDTNQMIWTTDLEFKLKSTSEKLVIVLLRTTLRTSPGSTSGSCLTRTSSQTLSTPPSADIYLKMFLWYVKHNEICEKTLFLTDDSVSFSRNTILRRPGGNCRVPWSQQLTRWTQC